MDLGRIWIDLIFLMLQMKIAVLGYWKEWKSTYNWLLKQWYRKDQIDILDKSIDKDYLGKLDNYDLIFKSPWISIYLPEIQKNINKITSQADIFFEKYKWKIILVTWSKGKSTTSTLMYKFLKQAGKSVKLVWNIWNPIFDEIDFENQPDYVIFEISSYMLDSVKKIKTNYGILTNIYEVHTSWHKTHENYVNSKLRMIFENPNGLFSVYKQVKSFFKTIPNNVVFFWEWTDYFFDDRFLYWKKYKISKNKVVLWWNHNYLNIVSCFPILEKENISQQVIEKVLSEFNWLEHRQEFVGEINGIKFYNDSIATIPESVLQALERFWNQIDTIILWGKESGFDYSNVIEKINNLSLKNVILLPDSFDWLENKFENKNVYKVSNLKDAVKIAKEKTEKWKICILSPGAPSYNLFKNFEERGKLFKKYVGLRSEECQKRSEEKK